MCVRFEPFFPTEFCGFAGVSKTSNHFLTVKTLELRNSEGKIDILNRTLRIDSCVQILDWCSKFGVSGVFGFLANFFENFKKLQNTNFHTGSCGNRYFQFCLQMFGKRTRPGVNTRDSETRRVGSAPLGLLGSAPFPANL